MSLLQNRVTPMGEIIATPARGTLMGNRGCLHDGARRIVRAFQRKAWIYCVLSFKDRHRTVMSPDQYTELFFLDEATALAAGHRPCAECSRERYKEFVSAWRAGNPQLAGAKIGAVDLDNQLHRERLDETGKKRLWTTSVDALPAGTFIRWRGQTGTAAARLAGDVFSVWTPSGYEPSLPRPRAATVEVITPRCVVNAIGAGYLLRGAVHSVSERWDR